MTPHVAIEVLRGSLAKLIQSFGILMSMSAIPFAVLIAARFVPQDDINWAYVGRVIEWVAYSYLGVSVHRYVVLGGGAVTRLGVGTFGLRELRYFIFFMVLALGSAVVVGMTAVSLSIFPGYAHLLFPIAGPLAVIILSRFVLVLPAVALDRDLKLLQSFKITRFHWLSVIIVTAFVPIAVLAPTFLHLALAPPYVLPIEAGLNVLVFTFAVIGLSYFHEAVMQHYRVR